MNSKPRSWIVWFVPLLFAGGMALGAIVGFSATSAALLEDDPAGQLAGAAGALIAVLCVVAGFLVSALTLVAARVMRRGGPDRVALRVGLSVVGGGIIGALGGLQADSTALLAWALLVGIPAALAWPSFSKERVRKEGAPPA